jgi:hypothetical protein
VSGVLDSLLTENPPLADDAIRYIVGKDGGLVKVVKQALQNRKPTFFPDIQQLLCRVIDVAVLSLPFDNAVLLGLLADIFDNIHNVYVFSRQSLPRELDGAAGSNPDDEAWSGPVCVIPCILSHARQRNPHLYHSQIQLKLVNHLGLRNGFSALLARLRRTDVKLSVGSLKLVVLTFYRVLSAISPLAHPFQVRELLRAEIREALFMELQKAVFDLLLGLSDDELRPVKKEDIEEIVRFMDTIVRYSGGSPDCMQTHDTFLLQFSLKVISSSCPISHCRCSASSPRCLTSGCMASSTSRIP